MEDSKRFLNNVLIAIALTSVGCVASIASVLFLGTGSILIYANTVTPFVLVASGVFWHRAYLIYTQHRREIVDDKYSEALLSLGGREESPRTPRTRAQLEADSEVTVPPNK